MRLILLHKKHLVFLNMKFKNPILSVKLGIFKLIRSGCASNIKIMFLFRIIRILGLS